MEKEQLSVKIRIVDRNFSLKIPVDAEERTRAAAAQINEKVAYYKENFANLDNQDALSITSLQFVDKMLEVEQQEELKEVIEELEKLDHLLDEYITLNIA